jgi:type IV secretory pathway protease TraF
MRPRLIRITLIALLSSAAGLRPGTARADWPADPVTNLSVCTAQNTQASPAVASDGASGVLIAWQDIRALNYDIFVQHVVAGGIVDGQSWPANGRVLCNLTSNQTSPRIVSDGAGGALVVWQDARAVGGEADIYIQHVRATGAVDNTWPVNGLAVCTAAGNQITPNLVSDNAGGAIVGWVDFRTDTTLFLQRVRSTGQVDPAWPVNGRALSGHALLQVPSMLADGQGGVIVTWAIRNDGSPTADIIAQRVLASGALAAGWPAAGRVVCAAANQQQSPVLATDRAGGAVAAWEDQRSGAATDVYAQHVSAAGVVDAAWPADGRVICSATGTQISPRAASDGAGGAIIGWQDTRIAGQPDLYAQRVRATGVVDPAWPVNGRALCLATGSQGNLNLVADGTGGALASWDDVRSGPADVYAQHVLGSGAIDPAWTADGSPVCTSDGSQSGSAAMGDGAGGLILAWSDSRGTSQDIYAQRIAPNGQLGGSTVSVPTEPAMAFSLAPLVPTPARGGMLGLRFALPAPGTVSAELLDASGRVVARHDLGSRTAGPQSAAWTLERHVPPGLYFLRLHFGDESRTVRVVALD